MNEILFGRKRGKYQVNDVQYQGIGDIEDSFDSIEEGFECVA